MNILRFMIPKSQVVYITDTATVRQALEKMQYHRYIAIPILDREGKYIGTLRSDDIFGYFLKEGSFDRRSAEEDMARDIISGSYCAPLVHSSTVPELIEGVREHNFVPVVDDRGCFIGIILRRTVMDYLLDFYRSHETDSSTN